jgi:hypothetical protein
VDHPFDEVYRFIAYPRQSAIFAQTQKITLTSTANKDALLEFAWELQRYKKESVRPWKRTPRASRRVEG